MMRYVRLSSYFTYYSSLKVRPKFFHVFLLLPNMFLRGLFKPIKEFKRFVEANQLPEPGKKTDLDLPDIELMICATIKDFSNLNRCIYHAIKNSENPISQISIIVPHNDIAQCRLKIGDLSEILGIKIIVIDEDKMISSEKRNALEKALGKAYGWGLQQFLTVAFVLESSSRGVLAVNADTLILRKRTWIRSNNVQELLVSSEFHRPYYQVLYGLNADFKRIRFTFICHQMLFQPCLMKIFLAKIGVQSTEELIELTLQHADCSVRSPFCIEFEFYAQSLYLYKNELVQLIRFANIPFIFSSDEVEASSQLRELEELNAFNSVSQHSWMQA